MSQSNGSASRRGTPLARKMAQLRKAFLDMISEQDIRDILAALRLKAEQGNLAAARLLRSYTVGGPTEPENPDRLS